ncbi:EAL domain-containing protein [Aquabacterium sp.]|uniref:EAL domain-containing protein n=1 Tax=Aquabacterium sp. TaxID=1872578 RepID=UPI0037831684
MFWHRHWHDADMPGLPQSLRSQFMLGLASMSLLFVGIGLAAILALRNTSDATQLLAHEQLQRLQKGQAIVQHALSIQREVERFLAMRSAASMVQSHADIGVHADNIMERVRALAAEPDDPAIGQFEQACERLRRLADRLLEQQLNGPAPQARGPDIEEAADALAPQGPRAELAAQAQLLVASAMLQSAAAERAAQDLLQTLVERSQGNQRGIVLVLAIGLLFTWLVAGLFLGRHLLQRLDRVSQHLRHRFAEGEPLAAVMDGHDEIAEMARAVERLLADRAQLELRTAQLGQAKETLTEQGRILEMIAARVPLPEVLDRVVRLSESQLQDIHGSILLLDEDGRHLRHGAAPGLPAAFSAIVDGWPVGPASGSCGTAIHRRETVIVSDIETDPLWAGEASAIARHHGLRACWSTPIMAHDGAVLGTFAMYARTVRRPGPREQQRINLAVRIAGIAIERQRAEQRIRHMAHHDELTGLPNRALLNDRLAQALAQARRGERPLALLFLDLDGFKHINDSLGHAVGDRLLQAVAQRLRELVREGDTVARLGGDEFVVMLVGLERAEDAARAAQDIVHALAQPFVTDEHQLHISVSIGISAYPSDGDSAQALLKHADAAMYRTKAQGRNGFQWFTAEMGLQAHQRVELLNALRVAVAEGGFELHYQPQVDLASGRIASVEALIRWHHPQLGLISPERFIPLAEDTGLIAPIGEWVLREACRQLAHWHAAGHPELAMAVNLSARQFEAQDLPRLVQQALQAHALPAHCLELELTETALMHNAEAARQTLLALHALGVKLALDDFGTGYSSLSHLRRFPIDTVKIDKSFIADLRGGPDASSIIRAIVVMARSLGMTVVGEGIETPEQLHFLAALPCQRGQGYLLARPLPADTLAALLGRPIALPAPAPAQPPTSPFLMA